MVTKNKIAYLLQAFSPKDSSPESLRRVALLVGLSLVGIIFLLMFSIIAFVESNITRGIFDATTAIILSLNLFDTKRRNQIKSNINIGIAIIAVLYIYLFVSGGKNNTAYVWYYTYPLISCYLLGSRNGAISSGSMLLPVLAFVFINPVHQFFAHYSSTFILRFVAAYFVVAVFSYLFERTREINQLELKNINQSLESLVTNRTSALLTANEQLREEVKKRKQALHSMRLSHKILRTVLDSIDATIYVADMETYEVLFMNKYMKKAFGGDRTGKLCWDAFRNESGPCSHCTNPILIDEWEKPSDGIVWEEQNPITGIWYANYDRAITWIDGRLVRIQIAFDISEQKTAEENLRKTENKFVKLFEATPCWSMLTLVNEGIIIEANDTFFRTSGYDRKEVIGHTGYEFGLFLNSGDREKVLNEFHKTGNLRDYSIQFRMKNGKIRDFLWSAETIDIDGRPYWVSAVLDITKRRIAEKEKNQIIRLAAEQEKHALVGRIAGKMAHDFNNILGIIMGNTELSLIDCKDADTKKTLALILEQTVRGKNLTKNLVAFAKDHEPKQEFIKISEKIDLVLTLMRKDLKGVELITENSPAVPELLADPGMIEHALVNLIQNAVHALSRVEHPRIIIRTYSRNNRIYIEIEDNGCGIPKENIRDIYEPSFTLKGIKDVTGSYKPGIKGTGYGMSNVKKYIDQHKGDVSILSTVGEGTRITIDFPVSKKAVTQEEIAQVRQETVHFNKYILLVEDEQAISDVQYQILTAAPCNHKVDISVNGQMAMDLLDRNRYDFISLDYELSGEINGMDVYHHIRKSDKRIPVLFISGNLAFLESLKSLQQNDPYVDHLSKPCQNMDYIKSINELIGTL